MDHKAKTPCGIIFRLSFADLKHEWTLTLCLMLAIAAVIAPLLLLFGLKYGTIETLRERLIQNPRNREIRPLISRSFEKEWFDAIRKRDDIAFITPMTRQISSQVSCWVIPEGDKNNDELSEIISDKFDLIPSGPKDPLLVDNNSKQPTAGQCALSYYAAEAIRAQIGDTLTIEASRTRRGKREKGTVDLKLIGILEAKGTPKKTVYVSLKLLEQVETFKDGQGVPELGWKGDAAEAYPMWNGVVVSTPKTLKPLISHKLRAQTGFTKSREINNDASNELGYKLPEKRQHLLLYTALRPLNDSSIVAVQNQLRGRGAVLLPWVKPLSVELFSNDISKAIKIRPLPAEAHKIKLNPLPSWKNPLADGHDLLRIMIPESWGIPAENVSLRYKPQADVELVFPVEATTFSDTGEDTAYVPSRLAGILNLAKSRELLFDLKTGEFLLNRKGYAGFRLYATTLESVDPLRHFFEDQGIPVHTEASKIESVLEMDRYLTLIFWLIAIVGILGSVAALLASLYASVERKRKELSVLQLLGFSASQLFRYPVYQGMVIAAGGFVLAWIAFFTIGETINQLFSNHLQHGESFCTLPVLHLFIAFSGTVLLACFAAFAAVLKLSQIEPAESLRDE